MAMAEATIPEWTRGDRMAKARDSAGLTQQQLADRLDVKRTTLSAWESGTQPRDLDWVMTRYHEETGVDLAWLYGFRTGSFATPFRVIDNPDAFVELTLPFGRQLTPIG